MGKKKIETAANDHPETRTLKAPKTVAPRAARRKAPLAAEAIAEFTGTVSAPPVGDLGRELPLPEPTPAAPAVAERAVTKPDFVGPGDAQPVATADRHPLDLLRDVLARVRSQIERRLRPHLAPLLRRVPFLSRFVR